jgi:hypothetical protein
MMKNKLIGTLKQVKSASKVTDSNAVIHTIELKVEIAEGHEQIQEIVESLKEVVELTVENKQPRLQ